MKYIQFFVVFFVLSCTNQNKIDNNKNLDSKKSNQNQAPNPYQAKQYVFGTDDIPLFDGLKLTEDESSNFDTMAGNIVISKYTTASDAKLIKGFYAKTLPQLGWVFSESVGNKMLFIREKDRLEISIESVNKTLFVRFFILYQI